MMNLLDGSHLEVPHGSFMEKDGRYSFPKLLHCARMAIDPKQPIKALIYLTPQDMADGGYSSQRNRISIHSNASMERAFHQPSMSSSTGTNSHVMLQPVFQANPLKVAANSATFLLGDCSPVDNPPRVRLCADNAVVGWDLSSLVVPGRYSVSVEYYRGVSGGSVFISAGVVQQYPLTSSSITTEPADLYRTLLPSPTCMDATGSNPYDIGHYKEIKLGEFECVGEEEHLTNEHFVIVAEKMGQPLMSIRSLEFTYLGHLRYK